MGLTTKEWTCQHEGHAIRVVNSWFSGAKLYVDGDCRDTNRDLFSVDASRPLLSCSLPGEGGARSVVEVYLVAVLTTRAMICVDGRCIAGDLTPPTPVRSDASSPAPYRGPAKHDVADVGALQRSLANARTTNRALVAALAMTVTGVGAYVAAHETSRSSTPCAESLAAPSVRVAPRLVRPDPAPSPVGCADGAREAFRDVAAYPRIAACAGGFDVPGLAQDLAPVCARGGGDDGHNPAGRGCAAEDLCAVGWHVCRSAAEVSARSPDGCVGSHDAATASFFATRQSSSGCARCATGDDPTCGSNDCRVGCAQTAETTNDVFGCGTLGNAPDPSTCGPLDRFGDNLCDALRAPWRCEGDPAGVREALRVTKPGPEAGGVLCCAD